jgi:hypothetical protein
MTTPTKDIHGATARAASAETKAEHSDARWADWQRRGGANDDATRRRSRIIAAVMGAGLVAWLVFTLA